MQHQEFAPAQELKDFIKCFWHNRNDFGEKQTSFEVVPDGYAEIIFHFGSGCSISHNEKIQPLPSPFMVGLLNKPVTFHAKGILEIIAIRCYPWTVFDLLGLSSGKDSVRMFQHPIALLQPALEEFIKANKINEAIAHVEKHLVDAQLKISADATLSKAGTAMHHAKGNLPVSQVAAAAHATVRTLERKFKQSSGHTVKDVAGLMRFEQARNQLWLHPETNLAGLAQELGYADQAHLSKEFKRYSGTTPAAFARNTKKRKQLMSDDFVAFVATLPE